MTQDSIAPRLWLTYEALRERRSRVDVVLAELEAQVRQAPELLRAADVFTEQRALTSAFPEKPLDVSIAVIGVFRGGKSTIINALLGASLLPAAHAATTATITKIRYRRSGYVVRVQYTGPEEESFRAARDELLALLQRPLDDAKRDLRDPKSRAGVEALLGMYGALGEHNVLVEGRVDDLHAQVAQTKALPPFPHQALLGQSVELSKADLATIEDAVRPYVMFTGAGGEFDIDAATRQFMISSVTIEGPFDVLASKEGGVGSLTLVDTPGLEDPRPFVKKMVHGYLRSADCVCLNVSNAGNISATDVDVLRLLLNETLHRKLIVTLGKIDTLGASDAEVQAHVARQRKMLEARVVELHPGDPEAAKRFIVETPVLPVVALASLHRTRLARGTELDRNARRLIEDYPTSEEDGTAALFEHIRRTLEGSARLAGVVERAEEALNKVVSNASAGLTAAIDDRMLNAEQLEQKAKELARMTAESNRAMKTALDKRVGEARARWKARREDDRARFDARLAEVALGQLQKAREFVAQATAAEWRHWKRLRAVADRGTFASGQDAQLRDDIALHALGGVPSLLRAALGTILATAAASVDDAATMFQEASRAFAASAGAVDVSQMTDIRVALQEVTGAELRAATAEYRGHTNALATKFFEENAASKMSEASAAIVVSWIVLVREDSGKGIQARMHAALDRVMVQFVTGLPGHVRDMFSEELDELFRASEEGAVQVYERVAQKASSFLADRLRQLEESARRATTVETATIAAEKRLLTQYRERLEAAQG